MLALWLRLPVELAKREASPPNEITSPPIWLSWKLITPVLLSISQILCPHSTPPLPPPNRKISLMHYRGDQSQTVLLSLLPFNLSHHQRVFLCCFLSRMSFQSSRIHASRSCPPNLDRQLGLWVKLWNLAYSSLATLQETDDWPIFSCDETRAGLLLAALHPPTPQIDEETLANNVSRPSLPASLSYTTGKKTHRHKHDMRHENVWYL